MRYANSDKTKKSIKNTAKILQDKKKVLPLHRKTRKIVLYFCKGRYQSGQMGLTVTQLATPSVVRIHLCPQASKKHMRK